MFGDLRISELIFNYSTCSKGRLPEYKGSALRGLFGHIFKDVVCSKEQKDCGICEDKNGCVYLYLFETPATQSDSKFPKYSDVPRPYVIDLCDTSQRVFSKGDLFQFGLVLIGKAIECLPYFIFGFDELGRKGLGTEKVKFDLQEVCGFDFDQNQWVQIYDPKIRILSDNLPTINADRLPYNLKETLSLEFLTPTRIKYRESYITNMEFHVMIRNLLRRISMLMLYHCDSALDIEINELIEKSKTVDVLRWDLRWHDWTRYSSRQKELMKLGGFIGSVTYKGDFEKFMPFIALGEQIHIGKSTTFGLGKYRICKEGENDG
ncbi:MAG: system precrRNA processing endoribonuclease protein Cas6 [Candidatus Poribacteria bacterium]|nr:system precrRNA processing endoribonuclease protein Cas6 [Candidatus Poribacteria bacterium]